MRKFRYNNWSKRGDIMEKLQNSININMYIEYLLGEIYKNSVERDENIDEKILNNYINLLRQFLYMAIECEFIDKNNFENVVNKLKEINYFEFINDSSFKAHGMVNRKDNHIIFKDSNMKNDVDRVIFAFHEFFHALTKLSESLKVMLGLDWDKLDNIYDDDFFDFGNQFMVSCGYSFVIDDCFAQEVAEILAYKYLNKKRPDDMECTFDELFGDVEFSSNWSDDCYYRVFHESFRNLMGIDMNKFIRNCFDGCFNDEFFKNCNSMDEKILLFFIFKNWFNIIASIYAYMDPNNCFTSGENKEIVTYSKEVLEESYEVSLISSVNFKKRVLERK